MLTIYHEDISTFQYHVQSSITEVLNYLRHYRFHWVCSFLVIKKTFPLFYFRLFLPEFHEFMVGEFHCIDFFSGKLLCFIFQNNPYFGQLMIKVIQVDS